MVERNDKDQLLALIDEYSFEKFYVKYKGFMVNHMVSGQVALFRMGAPMKNVKAFSDNLSKTKLEKKGGPLNKVHDAAVEKYDSIESLRGSCSHYYEIFNYMKNQYETTYKENLDDFIAGEFTKMQHGIAHNALHPLIHIGYGYSVGSVTACIEGIAFLFFSDYPLKLSSYSTEKLGRGGKTIVEVLHLIHADDDLFNSMMAETEKDWIKSLSHNFFFSRMIALIEAFGDRLLEYVHMLNCPTEPEALVNWIIDQSIILYQVAGNKNDFFLLHGVTSSWSLSMIIPLLKSKEIAMETLQTFLCVLLGVYLIQERPTLHLDLLESRDVSDLTWEALLIQLFEMPVETDEHVYKLVQCCYEASLKNPDKSDIFKRASLTSMENKFFFSNSIKVTEA